MPLRRGDPTRGAGTGRLHPLAEGLGALPGAEVLDRLLSAQAEALAAVRAALPAARLRSQGVTAGIGPEHLGIAAGGPLPGSVIPVERLGSDTSLLVARTSGETVTVRLFGQQPQATGDAVALAFDPAPVLRFDGEGRRIR